MAPNKRVVAAYRAMGSLGIDESKVKSALKKLLKVFDKNWELIEAENYRVLADAIFEEDDNTVPKLKKKIQSDDVHSTCHSLPSFSNNQEDETESEEAQMHNERAQPLKRLRLRDQESQPLHPLTNSATSPPSKRPKLEDNALHQGSFGKKPQNKPESSDGNPRIEAPSLRLPDDIVDKGKQPASTQVLQRGRKLTSGRSSPSTPSKEPTVESGKFLLPNNMMPRTQALIIPKDEPIDEVPDYEMPIAVIPPEPSSVRDSSLKNGVAGKHVSHVTVTSSECRDGVRDEDASPTSNEEATCNVEIASSTLGEVKLSLSCSSALWGSKFHMPRRDEIIEMMEEKCLFSYKIADPNFSVMKLLRDLCDCMLEFGNNSNNDPEESSILRSNVDVSKESQEPGTLDVVRNKDLDMLSDVSNGPINVSPSAAVASPQSFLLLADLNGVNDAVLDSKMDQTTNDFSQCNVRKELECPISPNSHSLVIVPQDQLTADDIRSFYDISDLTKGEENVEIPWVNEYTNDFPPSFNYIPQNLVFQDAYVNISLSRVGSEDCCSTCAGNCVLSIPCACANKTGGEFAYGSRGLLKEQFLNSCIAISRNPQKHFFYCKNCPLDRIKNDGGLEPCKGHLKRKFIKECWSKCGCGKHCGNRVIQRGMTCKLQVFFTSEGKGWGLRTLEDLPKGAFVCEFVGEILSIKELYERNMKCTGEGKHTYPVLLDANWDSGHVNNKEALCLDAASFGNIARFINHRCFDANLVEIPVEVEDPGHYYYHFAFFTSRKISAHEELTWDYGIDFDDHDHPLKLFQCSCGSKFCRHMKRSNRSNISASISE
ncbi:hypothetical protein PHAVU_007G189700 [Phaseolus vulgaris]|uniref:SET domain-containing protein n=1 Tax=Phaseolus vulgaris TaxID=3885 RepID=V7BG92_PHAVU|nr:hypothetical protein PHAVU_007G189700g [Phaseolus vulgaris]XP_007144854.1 hypothetical protein PHAVU_007G189700g [Phaseolus vulgaris]ESW16847.1 hypothetical protein PHAVU_007G189700g [Phaseolus vulgaris]ESW16848.1 hypothetical protein PHAVU_007G189700g [Phaseolus vulgaris]